LSAAVSASGADQETVSNFTNIIEAEDAEVGEGTLKGPGVAILATATDSLTFRKIGISQDVDTLKIVYSSLFSDKEIDVFVNNSFSKSLTLPKTIAYDTLKVVINIPKQKDILFKSKDTVKTYIDKIIMDIQFTYDTPKDYIAVGQGFFLASSDNGGNLVFKNSQREDVIKGSESFFFKGGATTKRPSNLGRGAPLPVLKLGMDYRTADNLKFHRQIAVSFKNGNSFAHENGYDSEMYDMGDTDMSWKFSGNPLNYVIAGVQPINTELEVPLEIVTDALKDVTIKIDEIESINYDIYLKDKTTNTLHSLTDGPATIQLAAGTYSDRFVIAFQAKALSTEDIVLEENTQVYFDGSDSRVVSIVIINFPFWW